MTYGEMKGYVLQLLNQYSVDGETIPLHYNNQADLVIRMPGLVRDGVLYVTTVGKRLRTASLLTDSEEWEGGRLYRLPRDLFQMVGGLVRADGSRLWNYRRLGSQKLLLPQGETGPFLVEYFRYPVMPEGEFQAEDVLDCPEEALGAVAFYVAAHLAMEDNGFVYGSLYNEFEARMARLRDEVFLEAGTVEDRYGA